MNYRCSPRHFLALAAAVIVLQRVNGQSPLEAPFTRITDEPLTSDFGEWSTPAWGDMDNDGWLDLFISNHAPGGSHGLFRNNRDGTFTKVTTGAVATASTGEAFGAAWADYDNDGWLDLVVSGYAPSAPNAVFRNTGGGTFQKLTSSEVGSVASVAAVTLSLSWIDYDKDGYLDLFAANGSGGVGARDFLYRGGPAGRFTRVTNAVTTALLPSACGSWSDYDGDGDPDLFVANGKLNTGSVTNALYRNEGGGEFTNVTAAAGLAGGDSFSAAWADYDNDGDTDLLIINMGFLGPVAANWLYRNKGDGTFEKVTTGPVAEDRDHFVSGSWVDYDNDGWLDLFVTILGPESLASDGTMNRLYRNRGDGTFVKITDGNLVTEQGGYPGGAAWGDYDNDGFPDVSIAYGASFHSKQQTLLYRNNGNSNNWIKVRCIGAVSNRSAIGAKIRVKARIAGRELWQMREVGCGQDWVAFNSLDQLVGLGDASSIDILRVEWPSGIIQELRNVPPKQTLTIVEKTELLIQRPTAGGQFELSLKGPRETHYRLEASTNLLNWAPITSLTVTNTNRNALAVYEPGAKDQLRFFRALPE